MSLIDFTIPNLYNGVSQQPVTVRLPNQLEEQINGYSSVTNGLTKRNAARLVRRLRLSLSGDPDHFNQVVLETCVVKTLKGRSNGSDVVYQLIIDTNFGRLWVNRITYPASLSYVGQYSYLVGQTHHIKIISDGNQVYILNKNITTIATETDSGAFNQQGSLVNVFSGSFSNDYVVELKVKQSNGSYLTPTIKVTHSIASSSVSVTTDSLKTSTIATDLKNKLNTAIAANAAYSGVVASNENADDSWFKVAYSSTSTNTVELKAYTTNTKNSIFAFNRVVKDVVTLPNAPSDYCILVDSSTSDSKDNYYLTFNKETNIWQESTKLGLTLTVTTNTLPVYIKDTLATVDVNYMSRIEIADRVAGDSESNPLPVFLNNKINDIFLFNNRLGFLAGTNVIMSRIDEYSMFFRTSNAAVLGADRIDLKASIPSAQGSDLKFTIPYDNEIILSSGTAQYSLKSNAAFDPKTASLSTLTEYAINTQCTPINIGTSIYMTAKRGEASAVLDFSRRSDVGVLAEDITQHIPSYIKGTIRDMVTSTTENVLFLRSKYYKYDSKTSELLENLNDTVFVQNRFIRDGRLIQNAWHKWVFPNEDVVGIDIIDNNLVVTTTTNNSDEAIANFDDLYVYFINFAVNELGTTDDLKTINFIPNLNALKNFTRNDFANLGENLITYNPFAPAGYYLNYSNAGKVVMVTDKGQIIRGVANILAYAENVVDNTNISPNTIYYIGFEFGHEFEFSQQVVASYENGEKLVNQHANMLLRNMKISFVNTGKFDVIIKPKGRDEFTQTFSGMILGDESATLGRINISTGTFKFSIGARPDAVKIKIRSNYPFPTSFNTAEWQASVIQRSGRI